MTLHKDLTGADLHEPKGIATATIDKVYRADGAGSGSWQTLTIPTGLFTTTFSSFTASGTWSKPANLFKVRVHVVGAGGLGVQNTSATGATGGTVSFGAHASATGGIGGNTSSGGAGGVGTASGGLVFTGQTGDYKLDTTDVNAGYGGMAGAPFGVYGKGGNGYATTSFGSGGGGGGGYAMKEIAAASLGATETVTVGTAGQNNGYVLVEQYISV